MPRGRFFYFLFSFLFHALLLVALSRTVFFTSIIPQPETMVRLVPAPLLPGVPIAPLPSTGKTARNKKAAAPIPAAQPGPAFSDPVVRFTAPRPEPTEAAAPPSNDAPRTYAGLKKYLVPPGLETRLALRPGRPAEEERPGKEVSVNPAMCSRFRQQGVDIDRWAEAAVAALCRYWIISPDLPLPPAGEVGVAISWDMNGTPLPAVAWPSGTAALDRCAMNAVGMSAGSLRLPAAWPEKRDLYAIFHFSRPDAGAAPPEYLPARLVPAGEENDPLIARLGLLDADSLFSTQQPEQLSIGIEMRQTAPYRLLLGELLLGEGTLQPGLNRLSVPTGGLFEQTGQREFRLELLAGSAIRRRSLCVRVALSEPANSGQVPGELRRAGFGVALFMDNLLLAWRQRPLSFNALSISQRDRLQRALERRTNAPPDPLNREERALQRASLPILALPLLALKAIRSAREKKKEEREKEERPETLSREFHAVMLLRTPTGQARPVAVTLSVG
jgi:hypothetical protein